MNIADIDEIVEATELIDQIGEYVIRKFISGNYVIIDNIGDFVIIEKEKADHVCSIIWSDLAPPEKLN